MTSTLRTARCGPACRVVWQGSRGNTSRPLCRFQAADHAWSPGYSSWTMRSPPAAQASVKFGLVQAGFPGYDARVIAVAPDHVAEFPVGVFAEVRRVR